MPAATATKSNPKKRHYKPDSIVETITPSKAKEYLERNVKNRPLRVAYINDLAYQMLEGKWELAQPISFDVQGNLLDGQHRLNAIVAAGTSVKMVVLRGMPSGTFGVYDQGPVRTAADLHHLMGGKSSNTACSIARSMIQRAVASNMALKHMTRQEIAEYALENDAVISPVISGIAGVRYVSAGEMGAFANAIVKYGEAKIAPMMQSIKDNVFAGKTDPMNTLAKWMIRYHSKEGTSMLKAPRYLCYAAAVLAIKATKGGRLLQVLKPKDQDFN